MRSDCAFWATVFVAWAVLAAMTSSATAECRLTPGNDHVAVKVIDAETIQLDDGSEVRLIGALAPRASDAATAPGGWPAEAAAKAVLEAMVAGKTVRLKFGGERRDRYGRQLAHVFVKGSEGSETWVQTAMLREGQAQAYAIQGNRACGNELVEAEAAARAVGRGVWSVPAHRVQDGAWPRDLTPSIGNFRVISGTIRFVSSRRDGYRLWLDAEGRRGEVTVAIRSGDRDLIGSLGGDLKRLAGRRIEARGWLDQRRGASSGPEIDVSIAGMIRLLDP